MNRLLASLEKALTTSSRGSWGKVNGATPESKVLFMSDTKSFFSKNHAWEAGAGDRNGRWAMVVEPDSTISYSEVDGKGKVEVCISWLEPILLC